MQRFSFLQSKIFWASVIVFALVAFGIWWLGTAANEGTVGAKSPQEKVQVMTSGYVAYTLTQEIGADRVSVSMLVPPGTEPHHFEPTPGTIIAASQADLFIYLSPQAEPWGRDIERGLKGVSSVAIAEVERGEDPHVWMTPQGALAMAKEVADALMRADPIHKKYYQQNLKQFEHQMQKLHQDFKQGLEVCATREVVHIGHLAFGQLAEAYGLHLYALTGTADQGEHSVRKLSNLIRLIRKNKMPVIFTEEMIPADLARTVMRETQVRILPLYTIEGISKGDFEAGVRYDTLMRRNLTHLQEGLKCQA